ncbi:hypothetical protein BD769DRAFT_260029 [Suillus cothurnatus]|nr:hypothetical protein BD769DRAFT_260029 [Suillus cothurnatus]
MTMLFGPGTEDARTCVGCQGTARLKAIFQRQVRRVFGAVKLKLLILGVLACMFLIKHAAHSQSFTNSIPSSHAQQKYYRIRPSKAHNVNISLVVALDLFICERVREVFQGVDLVPEESDRRRAVTIPINVHDKTTTVIVLQVSGTNPTSSSIHNVKASTS